MADGYPGRHSRDEDEGGYGDGGGRPQYGSGGYGAPAGYPSPTNYGSSGPYSAGGSTDAYAPPGGGSPYSGGGFGGLDDGERRHQRYPAQGYGEDSPYSGGGYGKPAAYGSGSGTYGRPTAYGDGDNEEGRSHHYPAPGDNDDAPYSGGGYGKPAYGSEGGGYAAAGEGSRAGHHPHPRPYGEGEGFHARPQSTAPTFTIRTKGDPSLAVSSDPRNPRGGLKLKALNEEDPNQLWKLEFHDKEDGRWQLVTLINVATSKAAAPLADREPVVLGDPARCKWSIGKDEGGHYFAIRPAGNKKINWDAWGGKVEANVTVGLHEWLEMDNQMWGFFPNGSRAPTVPWLDVAEGMGGLAMGDREYSGNAEEEESSGLKGALKSKLKGLFGK